MKFDFDSITDRTGTNAIKYDFAERRNKPKDVVSLWVADMDFPTAPCIQNALKEKSIHGIYGYSWPDERYYTALQHWFTKRYGFTFQKEWVVNTPGVVFAISTAIKALTKEQDAILIQKPVYYPFFNTIARLNRKVVNSPLELKNNHYEINFSDFEQKIAEENVKLFILCSPHNPGGRVWTKTELEKISSICLKYNVPVISDEIHSDIVFNKNVHTIYASLSEEALNNSIICTAPSKTFNLAGLQFSNIFIANKTIREKFIDEICKTGYEEPGIMGITAATAAYSQGEQWLEQAKEYIWNNFLFARNYIKENCPKINIMEPEGTYLLWLDFSNFNLSDKEISSIILNDAKVWLDDGTMFGAEGKKFQRINLATPRKILEEALKRICRELSSKV